jgi:peptide/nickel transport system substrate-binding protein
MLPGAILLAFTPGARCAIKNPDTFVQINAGDVRGLEPAWGSAGPESGLVINNVYDTLITYDGESLREYVPRVAEKVPTVKNGLASADGRTYRFPIRKGVRFHDGSELTPEDVRYSLLRMMIMDSGIGDMLLEPLTGCRSTRLKDGAFCPDVFKKAAAAVSIEGQDVVLRLPKPYPPILSFLAEWSYVVPKRWSIARGDWDGSEDSWHRYNQPKAEDLPLLNTENGSGPFRVGRWEKSGKQVMLERWDGYWRGPAKLKMVIIRAIPEFGTRKLMLASGDADSIAADVGVMSQLKGLSGVDVLEGLPSIGVQLMRFCARINPERNPYIGSGLLDGDGIPPNFFADRDVRLGFTHAFDYEGFLRDVYKGRAKRMRGFITEGVLGYDSTLPLREFDLAKAEMYLRRARGGDIWRRGFRLRLTYNMGSLARQLAAQMLKRNLEKLNPKFHVDYGEVDSPAFMDAWSSDRLPLMVYTAGMPFLDAHAYAQTFALTDPGHACTVVPPEFDRIGEEALRETDPARRAALYSRLQRLHYAEAPQQPLFQVPVSRAQRSWVRGYYFNGMKRDDFYPISKK